MSLHHITKREKVIVMLAVMSGLFLVALDQTIISTALGQIVQDFNSFSSLGFVITAYLLTSTVTTPIAGKLSDMYGRRPMLILGVVLFTLASLLSGAAQNIEWLIAARALQGIGGGFIMANAFTIVGDLFSPRERGKWQGLIGAVFGVSSAIGPLLGGWLTDGHTLLGATTDWRWTFFINVPIGIIATAVIMRFCPVIKHDSVHKPDYAGAALVAVILTSVILAVDNTAMVFEGLINAGVSLSFIKNTLWVVALLATGLFIAVENKAAQPIIPLKFFKIRTFSLMMLTTLLFGAAFLGSILYLTQFNQQVYGASPSEAGLMLMPMMFGMMLSSIGVGQIISKTGKYKRFIVVGFAMAALAILSLITLQPTTPYWQQAISMLFVGLGLGMANPILNLAVQNEFPQKGLGAATASVQLSRGLGSTIGTAVLSGMLTTGIMTSLGNPNNMPYVQSIKQSPQAERVFDGDLNADTLLRLNAQQTQIIDGAKAGMASAELPESVKVANVERLEQQAEEFNSSILGAFTKSLHEIFMVSSVLMVMALVVVSFIKEKPLKGDVKATPDE